MGTRGLPAKHPSLSLCHIRRPFQLKTSAVRPQIEEVQEELGKRGLDPEEAPMAARLQLVEDMEGDSERDAVRDAEQFVDQVGARQLETVHCVICTWRATRSGAPSATPSSSSTRWRSRIAGRQRGEYIAVLGVYEA